MKNQFLKFSITALLLVCSGIFSFGQNQPNLIDRILKNPEYKDRWEIIQAGRNQGYSDKVILEYLNEEAKARASKTQPVNYKNQPPATYTASCSGLGVEGGWGAWTASAGGISGGNITWATQSVTPTSPRFNLTSGNGVDGCTPGSGATDPFIQVVAPGFGSASIQMGQLQTNGSLGGCQSSSNPFGNCCPFDTTKCFLCFPPCGGPCASTGTTTPTLGSSGCVERLTYPLLVTAADTNFIYAYAVVLEDPGHAPADQPYVSLDIQDPLNNNQSIPCGFQKYVADPSLVNGGGFFTASCALNSVTYYKPWTLVGVNLSAYVGKTLNIIITNADCGPSGHYAQSYWDFSCGSLSGSMSSYCGSNAHICAASDPNINYTYQWYQNGSAMAPPTGTQQCIDPNVQLGDTFSVTMNLPPPSSCGFNMVFIPQQVSMNAFIHDSINCSTVYYSDSISPAGVNASSWNWSFPGGSPASSSLPNPVITYSASGTYSATCTITALGGCTSTITKTVTLSSISPPVATTNNTPPCSGGSSTTLCASGATSYLWSNGQTDACITVPVTTATSTYSVTGTGGNGCKKTVAASVKGGTQPTLSVGGGTTLCGPGTANLFASASSGSYYWSPSGSLSSAYVSNPVANPTATTTYTVTVTSETGCTNSATVSVVVNSIPFVTATGGTTICSGSGGTLIYANASGVTYSWAPSGSLSNPNISNPMANPNSPTTYIVTVTNVSGCTNLASVTIDVKQSPVADLSASSPALTCDGFMVPFDFTGSGSVGSWTWDFGDGTPPSTQHDPTHTFAYNGTYTVTLTVTDPPCSSTSDTTFVMGDLSGTITTVATNVFTPNNDGKNDCFHPAFIGVGIQNLTADSLIDLLSKCVELEIFDRWGVKMFESSTGKTCWDGKTKGGANAVDGTYYYISKFGEVVLKGYVTLLREK